MIDTKPDLFAGDLEKLVEAENLVNQPFLLSCTSPDVYTKVWGFADYFNARSEDSAPSQARNLGRVHYAHAVIDNCGCKNNEHTQMVLSESSFTQNKVPWIVPKTVELLLT